MGTSFFTKLFGTKQDKDLRSLLPFVEQVNKEESWASALSDDQFPIQTAQFRKQLEEGASLESLLPKAFALAREASKRVLGEQIGRAHV